MSAGGEPRIRYHALDGLRGLAALGVAAFHFGVLNHFYPLLLIRNAGPYVDLFFILSGFVIAHTYGERLQSARDAAFYLLRRFGRLWPLHAFTLLCLVLLELAKWVLTSSSGLSAGEAAFSGASALEALPLHLVFLQAFGIFDDYTWNGPSWSIGCEFWTYVVFALVCLVSGKRLRRMAGAMVVLGVTTLIVVNDGHLGATYDWGLFRCIAGFFTGVLVNDFLKSRPALRQSPHWGTAAEVATAGVAVIYICSSAALTALLPLSSFLPLLVFSVVIVVFAQERGGLSRWLLSRPAQSLGRWSYSIYMVHFVLLTVMNSALRVSDRVLGTHFTVADAVKGAHGFELPLLVSGDLLFILYLFTVIGCAALTWRFVEEPSRLYFNGLARRGETGGPAVRVRTGSR